MVELSSQTNSARNFLLGVGTASILSFCVMPNYAPKIQFEDNMYSNKCTSEKSCYYHLKSEVMPQDLNQLYMEPAVDIIYSFINNLVENSEKSPSQYSKTVDDHFWDLA